MVIEAISPDVPEQELRLACAELERRLRGGDACAAEEWLQRHPALAGHPDSALELVYTEFVVREQLGQRPTPEDWFARFPQWVEDLRELFQVHQVVGGPSGTPHVRGGDTAPGGPSAATLPLAERRLGDYEVLEELGRGGMGVVYKARHLRLGRLVALKVILAGDFAGPQEHARFRTEAEAAARLQHPNIVAIHEVGDLDGRPFVSLEFVNGPTLEKRLAGTPMPAREAARLVQMLAGAMGYAHDRGVVHRDLKPANVLLTADGSPKITDFGLAKRLDSDAGQTQSGAVVGTPSYMAPEQAAGRSKGVGPVADVYALGAILYELITGRPPFKGPTPLETLTQVLHAEPVRPVQLQPQTPADLQTVCLKCLHKEPGRRYDTAAALADDLQRFLDGRPITARPAGRLERAIKWVRRRPAAAALVAVSALAALALTTGSLGFAAVFQQERDHAVDQEQIARTERARAKRGEADARAATARVEEERVKTQRHLLTAQLWRVAGLVETDPWLGRDLLHDPVACPPELRDFCWGYYAQLCQRGRRFVVPLPNEGEHLVGAFRADGKVFATGGKDGVVRLWDLATGREVSAFRPYQSQVYKLALSADGVFVAAVSGGSMKEPQEVRVWVSATGKERRLPVGENRRVLSLAFSGDGKTLATGAVRNLGTPQEASEIKLWDVATGLERAVFQKLGAKPSTVALDFQGKLVAAGGARKKPPAVVRVWEVDSGRERGPLPWDLEAIFDLAFSADGKTLVAAGTTGIRLWDVAGAEPRLRTSLEAYPRGHYTQVALSDDGRHLAAKGTGPVLKLWDLFQDPPRVKVSWVTRGLGSISLAFVRKGRTLAWLDRDKVVKQFDLDFEPGQFKFPQGVTYCALSSNGKYLAVGNWEMPKGIDILEVGTSRFLHHLPVDPPSVLQLLFTSDNKELLGAGWLAGKQGKDRKSGATLQVTRWNVTTGKILATRMVPVNLDPNTTVKALTNDGRTVAVGQVPLSKGDKRQRVEGISVWDVDTGKFRYTLPGPENGVTNLAFSPDGRVLVTAGRKGTGMQSWDVASGRFLREFQGDGKVITFSADGKFLFTGGEDRAVQIRELATGRARPPLPCADIVNQLTVTGNAQTLAVVEGRIVKLWDLPSGQLRAVLPDPGWHVNFLSFSTDGKMLMSMNQNRTLIVWTATDGR